MCDFKLHLNKLIYSTIYTSRTHIGAQIGQMLAYGCCCCCCIVSMTNRLLRLHRIIKFNNVLYKRMSLIFYSLFFSRPISIWKIKMQRNWWESHSILNFTCLIKIFGIALLVIQNEWVHECDKCEFSLIQLLK